VRSVHGCFHNENVLDFKAFLCLGLCMAIVGVRMVHADAISLMCGMRLTASSGDHHDL
jgi:hypothetical protein